jgi:hypothetical protein
MADPQRKAPLWLAIRVALLLVGFFSAGAFMRSMTDDFSKPSWPFLAKIVALTAFGVVFVLGLQKINPRSIARWDPPRWSTNPFTLLRDPLGFFHLSAWYFISVGLGCLLLGLTRYPRNWVWELPIGIGIGTWVGVRMMSLLSQGDDGDAV